MGGLAFPWRDIVRHRRCLATEFAALARPNFRCVHAGMLDNGDMV